MYVDKTYMLNSDNSTSHQVNLKKNVLNIYHKKGPVEVKLIYIRFLSHVVCTVIVTAGIRVPFEFTEEMLR